VYAESWALVHMLFQEDPNEGRFHLLLSRLAFGGSSDAALTAVYGPNAVDSLDACLRRFAAHPDVSFMNYTFGTPFDAVPTRTRTLGRVEILMVLGELLAHADREFLGPAEEHLMAAWSADSTQALPAALLGHVCERSGRPAEADRWFEHVARLAPVGARASGVAGDVL